MASKTFLLLALAFAVVLLISSQVAEAEDGEVDGRGGYNDHHKGYDGDGHGGYNHGGHHGKGGGHGGYGGGHGGYGGGLGDSDRYGGCKHGCCGHYKHGGCKCCATFEEATAYKQTQN